MTHASSTKHTLQLNRRDFLKTSAAAACAMASLGFATEEQPGWEKIIVPADPILVNSVPSPAQLRYQTNLYGAFLHYGPAVFMDGNPRGEGQDPPNWAKTPDPAVFHPTQLDVEQWVRVAKSFDAAHIVFSAKHHNGFCLWPTQATDYSVQRSPWKNGEGDLVRELAEACRKHGLGLGLYYSGQDLKFPCVSGTPSEANRAAYWPVYKQQLTELMSNYGELACLWLDSYLDPFRWDVKNSATGKPYGDEITAIARARQPNMVIWGGTQTTLTSCSHREDGIAPYPLWNVVQKGQLLADFAPPWTEGWVVFEAYNCHGTFAQIQATPEQLMNEYYASVGQGANFLQALVPDRRGLIDDATVTNVGQFGAEVRRRFATPVARTDSSRGWTMPGVLEVDLGGAKKITHLVLEEEIAKGQHILKYAIDALSDGAWKTVAEGQSVGRKRIERFPSPIPVEKIRLRVVQANAMPSISAVTIHDQ